MSDLVKFTVKHEGQNYQLWKQDEKGEPRVKDLDLGAWLELGRSRRIRELHDRHADDLASLGEVSPYRAAKIDSDGKPIKGRPEEGYLYNEAQALFLIAKSEAPKGNAMLKAMIGVFLKVKDAVRPEIEAQLLAEMQQLRAQVHVLTGRHEQVIGEDLAKGVNRAISTIAAFRACVKRDKSLASVRKTEDQALRGALEFPMDLPWRLLSVFKYPLLTQELYRRERTARREAESAPAPMPLFGRAA